ncbi:hypothetical protein B0H14DRAFT_3424270 [Mycena olivaceomarginata]|nr:hypothetical protein B0H14DRAFT_3424270 [Mycena olivaceomarginata]
MDTVWKFSPSTIYLRRFAGPQLDPIAPSTGIIYCPCIFHIYVGLFVVPPPQQGMFVAPSQNTPTGPPPVDIETW